MKTILFFIQNAVGGAERMTINIAKVLPKTDWNIIFCKVNTPYVIQNGRIEDFIPDNIKITNISWHGQISFLGQLWKMLKKYKPNIVFSSVMPYNQRLLLLAKFFKSTKFIVRNDNYLFTLNKYKQFTLKYTYKHAHRIIAQTEEMKQELVSLGLDHSKIEVLHNFIDKDLIATKALAPSPYNDDCFFRFVSVGRISFQKGFDVLIRAFKIVNANLPLSKLYIVGNYEGNSADVYYHLLKLVEDLELQEKVVFTGYTDNPYKYIKHASVYVLSSRYEGLPNVLVEAQFLKIPSAATACIPMISRMIHNGENGYLAAPDNPEDLAKAMIAATSLKEFKPVYNSSPEDDFAKLFQD